MFVQNVYRGNDFTQETGCQLYTRPAECFSQADNTFFSQLALQLSVKLQNVTKEEIGLAVVLVTPRTPRTLVLISSLLPGFLNGADVQGP